MIKQTKSKQKNKAVARQVRKSLPGRFLQQSVDPEDVPGHFVDESSDLCASCSFRGSNVLRNQCQICETVDDSYSDINKVSWNDARVNRGTPYLVSAYRTAVYKDTDSRNEVVVLALGIRQYQREVFTFLDDHSKGYVTVNDLRLLCKVLGSSCVVEHDPNNSCLVSEPDICRDVKCSVHIHFERFCTLVGRSFTGVSPITENKVNTNSKLIQAVINISRRGDNLDTIKKALENIKSESQKYDRTCQNSFKKRTSSRNLFFFDKNKNISSSFQNSREHLKLQEENLLQQQELNCLREIVEDFRVALQSSDAENLALRVKFEEQNAHLEEAKSKLSKNTQKSNSCFESPLETSLTDSLESFLELLSSESSSSEDNQLKVDQNSIKNVHDLEINEVETVLNVKENMGSNIPQRINSYSKQSHFISNILDHDLDLTPKSCLPTEINNDLQQKYENSESENPVLERRERDLRMKFLYKILASMKANLAVSESKNFRLRRQFEQVWIEYQSERQRHQDTQMNKAKLKEETHAMSLEVSKLRSQLESLTYSRKSDLEKLKLVRQLLRHSLSSLNQNRSRPKPQERAAQDTLLHNLFDMNGNDVISGGSGLQYSGDDHIRFGRSNPSLLLAGESLPEGQRSTLSPRLEKFCEEDECKAHLSNSKRLCTKQSTVDVQFRKKNSPTRLQNSGPTPTHSSQLMHSWIGVVSPEKKTGIKPPNNLLKYPCNAQIDGPSQNYKEIQDCNRSMTWDPSWSRKSAKNMDSRTKTSRKRLEGGFSMIQNTHSQSLSNVDYDPYSHSLQRSDSGSLASSTTILQGIENEIDQLKLILDLEATSI